MSELGFESTYSDSRSYALNHQKNTGLNVCIYVTFYGRTKGNYSHWGTMSRGAIGKKGTSNWALKKEPDFTLTEVEQKRGYAKEDYFRLRGWYRHSGNIKRHDVLGKSENLARIESTQLMDTSW